MKTLGKILIAMASPWLSRKLWMTLLAVVVIQGLFWTATWYLFAFTEQWKGELFAKMYMNAAWTISMMMLGYLGLTTLAQGWTNTTASATSSILNTILESKKSEETINQRIEIIRVPSAKHFDGPDIE